MGKIRKKRQGAEKHNPTGIMSEREVQQEIEEESVDDAEAFISSVSEQLQSKQTEEKCSACNKLAVATDPELVAKVLNSSIIKILAPLLVDRNDLVRHTAAGALRNLSVTGGPAGCDTLIDHDVMTPVIHLLKKRYCTDWTLSKGCLAKNRLDAEADTFLHTVHLLFNLCESNSTCVKIFTSEQLLPVLIRCLNPKEFTMKITIAVAHCLHVVSEDNPKISEALTEHAGLLENLLQIEGTDSEYTLLKVVVAGILLNVNGGRISMCSIPHINLIMNQLSSALQQNYQEFVSQLIDNLPNVEQPEGKPSLMEQHMYALENVLLAQKTALEILTNICSGEEEEWEAMSSSSSDDAIEDVDYQEDGMDCTTPCATSIPIEAEEVIISGMLVKKIMEKVDPVPSDLVSQLSNCGRTKYLIPRFATVSSRALSCFHNLVSSLGVDELGGGEGLYEIWCKLGTVVFKATEKHEVSHVEAATSVLRAILQKLGETDNAKHVLQVTPEDLQNILQVGLNYEDPSVRVNVIKIVGTLGSLLAQNEGVDINEPLKVIGNFLLEVSTKDNDVWVMAEALDALFDAFAEDHTDGVAVAIGLVEKLKPVIPQLKHKARSQSKNLAPEQNCVVSTARTNLSRFLKYKSSRSMHSNGTKC